MARKGASRIGFYIILGLLFVGLIGFGSTNLTGTRTTVAVVGDEEVTMQDYVNALNQQLRSFQATLGQPLTMEQARSFGLDQAVLARLVAEAALDDEAGEIGLSVGDAEVRDRVLAVREFQGLEGQFDRETYRGVLENIGLSEAQFEDQIRDESARALLQAAIVGAVAEPETYAEAVAAWAGERRTATWLRLGPDDLEEPVPAPTEEELRAWLEANPEQFTTPEIRRISYAWLTPEMLAEEVEVPEEELRAAYEQRLDQYVQPERRLVERLVFPDEDAAEAAMAALEEGTTQFEALVTGRGLRLADVDQGDVAEQDLGAAGEAVFATEPGEVVGPLPTDLGPALFRVNAVLAAEEITFEEAAPDLRAELAAERARRQISGETQGLADLIAGGATIEDLAENSALELGQIDWSEGTTGGIADYDEFRQAAAAAEEGAFPELVELEDGGVFALRLDEVVAPQPIPFEEAEEALAEAVRAEATRTAVLALAESIAGEVGETGAFPEGREPRTIEDLTRRDFVEDAPEEFVAAVFEMDEGGVRTLPAEDGAVVVQLNSVAEADPEAEAVAAERRTLAQRVAQGIAEDIYLAYARAIQEAADVEVDDAALNAVLSQFPLMPLLPDFDSFREGFEAGRSQVVWTRLAADLDTPVSLMLKLAGAGRHAFVLESVTGGEVRGRYSMVGMNPDLVWECRGTSSRINRAARYDDEAWEPCEGDPLAALRALLAESRIELPEGLPAASAGLFGYLGYDMIRLVERLPDVPPDPIGLPDAVLLRPSVVAVLDGVKGDVILVAPAWAGSGLSARAAYAQAAERVMDAQRALDRPVAVAARALSEPRPEAPPVSNFTKADYKAAVEKAKAYIRAGDIFQVVPSQRWTLGFREPPFALYRSLRRTNPSPFMFFFNFGDFQVIGASPEILVRVFGREVTIRPIAGTRPRGATPAEDKAHEADLMADQKELAEHLMLLDLGRNDVGRVAKVGTVTPTEKFLVERYSHVMHIVSNVVGELDPGHDALSALLAGLPAGTVSGAPKVRAMQIIDELEPEKRGVYGGGVGYFSAGGDMDMCIALRTAVLKDEKLYIQAGGGIVWDSDPEAEYMETVHKSNAIRKAAEDATMFRPEGNG